MRTKFAVMFLLATAALSCMAADMNWHSHKVTFADPAVVGGTPLPAGVYNVEHQMRSDEHVMVFTKVNDKKFRAESKCHMLNNARPAIRNEQAYRFVDGKYTLITLMFKGDVFLHELY